MARADFYLIAKPRFLERPLLLVCELARKACDSGQPLLIFAASMQQAEILDELLWEFDPDAYVPHQIAGDEAANLLTGVLGNDAISGGDGDDFLVGGDGRDRLDGNDGSDRLDGRDGADLLGRTETAQSALTAQSAVTAQNVGGVEARRISHRSASPANATVLDLRGFRLRVECQSGNEKLFAETSVADGELVSVSTSATGQPAQNYWDDDFTPGESLNLTLAASSNDRLYDIVYNGGDGAVVSVQVVTDDDIGADDCIVGGHALG